MRFGGWLVPVLLFAACLGPRPTVPDRESLPASRVSLLGQAPLALSLDGRVRDDGTWELTAEVTVSGTLAVPPILRVELPDGARLLDGRPSESLPASGTDATRVRRFVVADAPAPVQVVVSAVAGGYGASVAASWPPVGVVDRVGPSGFAPIRPTRVGGMPVDRAVPLGSDVAPSR